MNFVARVVANVSITGVANREEAEQEIERRLKAASTYTGKSGQEKDFEVIAVPEIETTEWIDSIKTSGMN